MPRFTPENSSQNNPETQETSTVNPIVELFSRLLEISTSLANTIRTSLFHDRDMKEDDEMPPGDE